MRNALIFIGLCSLPAFAQWVDHGTVMEATDKISVNAGSTVSAFSQMDIKGGVILESDTGNRGFYMGYFYNPSQQHDYGFLTTMDFNTYQFTDLVINGSGGKVGIGTRRPQTTLSVNGTITAKEVIVSLDPIYWPDYVFDDDYELYSLPEVDQFIKDNGHLPGVPSQEDIASGVEVGEMQHVLLEKVEELTLYVIDLEKRNKVLEGEIGELKKRNQ